MNGIGECKFYDVVPGGFFQDYEKHFITKAFQRFDMANSAYQKAVLENPEPSAGFQKELYLNMFRWQGNKLGKWEDKGAYEWTGRLNNNLMEAFKFLAPYDRAMFSQLPFDVKGGERTVVDDFGNETTETEGSILADEWCYDSTAASEFKYGYDALGGSRQTYSQSNWYVDRDGNPYYGRGLGSLYQNVDFFSTAADWNHIFSEKLELPDGEWDPTRYLFNKSLKEGTFQPAESSTCTFALEGANNFRIPFGEAYPPETLLTTGDGLAWSLLSSDGDLHLGDKGQYVSRGTPFYRPEKSIAYDLGGGLTLIIGSGTYEVKSTADQPASKLMTIDEDGPGSSGPTTIYLTEDRTNSATNPDLTYVLQSNLKPYSTNKTFYSEPSRATANTKSVRNSETYTWSRTTLKGPKPADWDEATQGRWEDIEDNWNHGWQLTSTADTSYAYYTWQSTEYTFTSNGTYSIRSMPQAVFDNSSSYTIDSLPASGTPGQTATIYYHRAVTNEPSIPDCRARSGYNETSGTCLDPSYVIPPQSNAALQAGRGLGFDPQLMFVNKSANELFGGTEIHPDLWKATNSELERYRFGNFDLTNLSDSGGLLYAWSGNYRDIAVNDGWSIALEGESDKYKCLFHRIALMTALCESRRRFTSAMQELVGQFRQNGGKADWWSNPDKAKGLDWYNMQLFQVFMVNLHAFTNNMSQIFGGTLEDAYGGAWGDSGKKLREWLITGTVSGNTKDYGPNLNYLLQSGTLKAELDTMMGHITSLSSLSADEKTKARKSISGILAEFGLANEAGQACIDNPRTFTQLFPAGYAAATGNSGHVYRLSFTGYGGIDELQSNSIWETLLANGIIDANGVIRSTSVGSYIASSQKNAVESLLYRRVNPQLAQTNLERARNSYQPDAWSAAYTAGKDYLSTDAEMFSSNPEHFLGITWTEGGTISASSVKGIVQYMKDKGYLSSENDAIAASLLISQVKKNDTVAWNSYLTGLGITGDLSEWDYVYNLAYPIGAQRRWTEVFVAEYIINQGFARATKNLWDQRKTEIGRRAEGLLTDEMYDKKAEQEKLADQKKLEKQREAEAEKFRQLMMKLMMESQKRAQSQKKSSSKKSDD